MPSAFIQFSNENRAEVQAANPKAGFGEMGKLLGKMWKALSEEEKAKYVSSKKSKKTASKKAAAPMAEEKKEPKAEEEEDEEEEEEKEAEEPAPKKSSSKKEASKKKRAPSAFIVFSNKMRDEVKKANPSASFSELGKLLGKKWQALSDQEKAAYKSGGRRGGTKKKNKY